MNKNIMKIASVFMMLSITQLSHGMMRKLAPRAGMQISSMVMPTRAYAQSQALYHYHKFSIKSFYNPGMDVKGYGPQTDYIDQSRDFLSLFKEYQDEHIARSKNAHGRPNYFNNLQEVYDKYQKLYEKGHVNSLSESIEKFQQTELPSIRLIGKAQEIVKTVYSEAYENYKQNPTCFFAYYYLAVHINDLLNVTSQQRALSEYVWKYKAKHESQKRFKLKNITYVDDSKTALAYYSRQRETLNFGSGFLNDLCLSQKAFAAMHEIEHSTQDHQMLTFDAWEDAMNRSLLERGADIFAASQLNCELCLKIEQLSRKLRPINQQGYFKDHDFDSYIESNKNNRCTAHCCDTKELEQALADKDMWQIKKLDNAMGTLYDRLPSVE